jgi:hypothetical protein
LLKFTGANGWGGGQPRMSTPTASEVSEALKLVTQLVAARDRAPTDARAWRELLLHAPDHVVMERAYWIRMARREARAELRKAMRRG